MRLLPFLCLIVMSLSKNLRPSHVQPELYCNSCQAMVREALKKLKNKRGEADIFEAIDNICSPRNYPDYMYPPPDMGKGCQAFITNHEEDLEHVLYNRDFKNPEEWLCNEISEACVGVDVESAHKNKPQTINFNNEEIPVNEDGTVNFAQKEDF